MSRISRTLVFEIQEDMDNRDYFEAGCTDPNARKLFEILGVKHVTAEELFGINIEFRLLGEDSTFHKLQLHLDCAIWYDKKRHFYFGRPRDDKGLFSTTLYATGSTPDEVISKIRSDRVTKGELP